MDGHCCSKLYLSCHSLDYNVLWPNVTLQFVSLHRPCMPMNDGAVPCGSAGAKHDPRSDWVLQGDAARDRLDVGDHQETGSGKGDSTVQLIHSPRSTLQAARAGLPCSIKVGREIGAYIDINVSVPALCVCGFMFIYAVHHVRPIWLSCVKFY